MAWFHPVSPLGPGRIVQSRLGGFDTDPRVTSLTPNFSAAAGGAAVTITGTRFRTNSNGSAPTVLFGAQAATSVVVVSATSITCVAPAALGGLAQAVDVSVTINGQTGTL